MNHFEQIVHNINPTYTLIRADNLTGGVSAQVTALEVRRPDGSITRWVVREHGAVDRAQNPRIAADEFRLLKVLHTAGVPVPQPISFDESAYIVIAFVEGETVFSPPDVDDALHQLAAFLVRLHHVAVDFLPRKAFYLESDHAPDEYFHETRIRALLRDFVPSANPPAVLHGDFWLGNVLWQDARIAAVIDWEDSAVGDPLAELANARLEILWALGMDAMTRFTEHYQAMRPSLNYAYLPYWDLSAALRPMHQIKLWGKSPEDEATMRQELLKLVLNAFEKIE